MINQNILNINLTELLINEFASLYKSEQFSDIILKVEGQEIPAHSTIFGARCEYFKTYFLTSLNERNQTIFELNVPLKPFEVLLEYFYTGKMTITKTDDIEFLIQILDLVEEYCLFYLKPHLEEYFKKILSVDNVCQLLEAAIVYELKELENESLNFIETSPDLILQSESFKKLSKISLEKILTRDTFCPSSELCIFNALIEWGNETNQNIQGVLHLVNLSELPEMEAMNVINSEILTSEILLIEVEKQLTEKPVLRSTIPKNDENVVTSKYNAETIEGDMKSELLNDNSDSYDDTTGFTRHKINQSNNSRIVVELGKIFKINHIKMLLSDRDDRTYSYFIEISTNNKKWKRIIDYSSYNCHSWQNLYFPAERVKFIKVVGIYCSRNMYFDIVKLEAYYKQSIPEIRNGFIVPNFNVALVSMGATVLAADGWQHGKNDLINCNPDSGWTLHEINSGTNIVIKLSQPFWISSIRLFLTPPFMYKFYIETSLNKKYWEKIVDTRNSFVSSLQDFHFPSKLVLFIRLVGTEIDFKCSQDLCINHFECPISVLNLHGKEY